MDGNGRWAQQRGLPRVAGHQAGVETLKRVVEAASQLGIEALTVYAFSTENWERPDAGSLLFDAPTPDLLRNELEDMCRNDVPVPYFGGSGAVAQAHLGGSGTGAAGHGGERWAPAERGPQLRRPAWKSLRAAMALAKEVRDGRVSLESIDEKLFRGTCTPTGSPTRICASAPAASTASAISSSGSWPCRALGHPRVLAGLPTFPLLPGHPRLPAAPAPLRARHDMTVEAGQKGGPTAPRARICR